MSWEKNGRLRLEFMAIKIYHVSNYCHTKIFINFTVFSHEQKLSTKTITGTVFLHHCPLL